METENKSHILERESDVMKLHCKNRNRTMTVLNTDVRLVFCPFCGERIGVLHMFLPKGRKSSDR